MLYKNIDNKKYWRILLVNEQKICVKRFRNFENYSYKENDFIQFKYGCVYKISSKTFTNGTELNP